MDTKHIERLLLLIVILLAINTLVSFKPYTITASEQGVGYRVNVYTGDIVSFLYDTTPNLHQETQP